MADPFDPMDNEDVEFQEGTGDAVIEFGDVTPDDSSAIYVADEEGIWTDYYVVNRYETDKQIWMMPVTSPGGFNGTQVAFCQLAAETLLLICDWTGEKTGGPPAIPKSEPTDENMILLDKHIEPSMKELGAGGAEADIIYRLSGTYVYGFKNPNSASQCFPMPPWMEPGSGECEVSDGLEQEGIMCCGDSEGDADVTPGDSGSQNSPTEPSQAGLGPIGLDNSGGFAQS